MLRSFAAAATALTLAVAPPTASATKLVMFNNSQVVPGTATLLEFDTETNTFARVAEATGMQPAEADVVDAAVLCGDKFYAVWTQVPVADGILQVDMKTRAWEYLPAGDGGNTGEIYHALACGASEDVLLGLATRPASGGGVSYHLMQYNATVPGAITTTEIGAFPASLPFVGYDTMYRFSADNKYLYASFANNNFVGKATSGSTIVMSTEDGSIAAQWAFPDGVGMPYTMLPTTTLGETFKGAFMDGRTFKVQLCDVSPSADALTAIGGRGVGSASVQNCKSANALYSASAPMPVCKSDGKLWTFKMAPMPGSPQPLTSFDTKTGEQKAGVDLSTVVPSSFLGTMAC